MVILFCRKKLTLNLKKFNRAGACSMKFFTLSDSHKRAAQLLSGIIHTLNLGLRALFK